MSFPGIFVYGFSQHVDIRYSTNPCVKEDSSSALFLFSIAQMSMHQHLLGGFLPSLRVDFRFRDSIMLNFFLSFCVSCNYNSPVCVCVTLSEESSSPLFGFCDELVFFCLFSHH